MERCRYDEIRSLYVQQLAYIWVDDSTDATRTSIDKKIDSFVQGDLEHAAETVSALWKIVNEDGDIKTPTNTTPAVSPLRIPSSCVTVLTSRSDRAGQEPRTLEGRGGRAYQFDSERDFLRPEILG